MIERIGSESESNTKRAALAVLGNRLERWDVLFDLSLPIKQRRERLMADINTELDALESEEDREAVAPEINELIDELEAVEELEDNEIAVETLGAKRKAYYSDLIDEIRMRD